MATEIVPGSGPVTAHPLSETFAAHAITTLSHPPESIDPESQAKACCQRARACMRAAQYARQDGSKAQAILWLKSAAMLRIAAAVWRQRTRDAAAGAGPVSRSRADLAMPTEDEIRGMAWWNGLREPVRLFWLGEAQRRKVDPADALWHVSAADAWAAFQARTP